MTLVRDNETVPEVKPALHFRRFSTADELNRLQAAWGRLLESFSRATVFSSWEWLASWWQAYGKDRELDILIWEESTDGRLAAAGMLYRREEQLPGGLSARVLRLVGDGSSDSDYLDFLVRPESSTRVLEEFANWLVDDKSWDAAVFDTLPQDGFLASALPEIAQKANLLYRVEERPCTRTPLPDSFESFLAKRKPRFRTRVRSLLRRFDAASELEFSDSDQALDIRLDSLYALHNARWRARGAPGVFEQADKRRFYQLFVPRFAKKGWLRFFSLRRGDDYVAHELCFGRNGTTFLLQEGFDISDPKAAYGQMLRSTVFRTLIDAGEQTYDFLGGRSGHKADWGAEVSMMSTVVLARKNLRGRLYFYLPVVRERVGGMLKRIIPEKLWQKLRPGS